MPKTTNKPFPPTAVILGFLLLPVITMSACSGKMEAEAPLPPVKTQPRELYSTERADLFDRYTVAGIEQGSYLKIHEHPSLTSPVLGEILPSGIAIIPSGEIYQDDDSVWAYITHDESEGWVNMEFLAEQHGSLPEELILLGQQIVKLLKDGQYSQLVPHIDPNSCLRFSPYQYLNNDNRIICPMEIENYIKSEEIINWGQYDGTGKPIDLTFNEYHQQFVYDRDYQKPAVVGFNCEVSSGNSINNIQEIYPDGMMIEYYFPGFDPQYGGMDWRSLRLVFVPVNDHWYLAAIIHGEWTI